MLFDLDPETGVQQYGGPRRPDMPELIYVLVVLRAPGDGRRDQLFILTKADLQAACVASYTAWMAPKSWRRPRNPASFDGRDSVEHVSRFEDNWDQITRRRAPDDLPMN